MLSTFIASRFFTSPAVDPVPLAKNVQRKVVHIAVVNQRARICLRMRNAHLTLAGPRAQPLMNAAPHVRMLRQQQPLLRPQLFTRHRRKITFFGRRQHGCFLFRKLGPARVADVAVEELHLLLDVVHLVGVLVEDVLLDELQRLELLAGEGAEPLVLGQLLRRMVTRPLYKNEKTNLVSLSDQCCGSKTKYIAFGS